MGDKGLVKHSWLCIWALQCLPRGLCFCKPLHTPPELQRLREDLSAAPQCADLLLTQPPSGVSVFLHVESSCLCLLSADHKQVPPCLTCAGLSCSRFLPVPFGSCSHSAFRQPVVHPERGLLVFLFQATVFTLTITPIWELWLLGCAFQTPAFSYL